MSRSVDRESLVAAQHSVLCAGLSQELGREESEVRGVASAVLAGQPIPDEYATAVKQVANWFSPLEIETVLVGPAEIRYSKPVE